MDGIRDALPKTAEVIAADFAAGQHKGFQVYVSLRGETVADAAWGEAIPGREMTTGIRVCWLSSGKPLTAMAIGLLWQRGLLRLDDPIVRFVPEFGVRGKDGVTVRHLLTHTGGLPQVETGYPEATWAESVARVCAAAIADGWVVGRTGGYHVASSWFVLGEIVQRVGGRSFATFLYDELCEPLGMGKTSFEVAEDSLANDVGEVGWMWRRVGRQLEPLDWHDPPRLTRASPGSSARGPIRELGRFYERLLGALNGEPGLFTSQTVEAMTSPHRVGEVDRTFQHVVDFGLGFLVDSNRYGAETVPYGFGRHCSPRAFGHGGAQSSMGFADPGHGLVVAWAANAQIGEPRHNVRNRAINTAVYEDLGLG